jgi:hypothetical protein
MCLFGTGEGDDRSDARVNALLEFKEGATSDLRRIPLLSFLKGSPSAVRGGYNMTSVETTAMLDAAQRLFGLTNAELEKILADPEQLLVMADILATSET